MGFELLDRKRNIIVREMMQLIDRAAVIQSQIDSCYAEAYQALQRANVAHGVCDDIAASVPVENGLELTVRSVMGVEIPMVKLDARAGFPSLWFHVHQLPGGRGVHQVRPCEEADRRTGGGGKQRVPPGHRRQQDPETANALKNIIIPRLTSTVKFITDSLEEKERGGFFPA